MDAIMPVLVATLLANADGRYGVVLAELLDRRTDRRAVVIAFFGAFLALGIASVIGAVAANAMLGLGVLNLFAAFALISAAGAVFWSGRRPMDAAALADVPQPALFVRLALLQLGDRNQFLIFALGALSGAAWWGVAGGAAGLLVAMLPILGWGAGVLDRRWAGRLRWIAIAALILWGLSYARAAFGV
jgi:putative Ca2+/H+ antiporter (TMEM165/GDT1 family)